MTIFQAWKILKIFAWNTNVEQIMTWLTHKFVIIGITIGKARIIKKRGSKKLELKFFKVVRAVQK